MEAKDSKKNEARDPKELLAEKKDLQKRSRYGANDMDELSIAFDKQAQRIAIETLVKAVKELRHRLDEKDGLLPPETKEEREARKKKGDAEKAPEDMPKTRPASM